MNLKRKCTDLGNVFTISPLGSALSLAQRLSCVEPSIFRLPASTSHALTAQFSTAESQVSAKRARTDDSVSPLLASDEDTHKEQVKLVCF